MLNLSTDVQGSRLVQMHGLNVARGEPGEAMRNTLTPGAGGGKFSGFPWWGWALVIAGAGVGASCLGENWPCEDDTDPPPQTPTEPQAQAPAPSPATPPAAE